MSRRFLWPTLTAWTVLAVASARAVVVAGDTGTTDEAAPVVSDAGGNNIGGNVGTFNGASGIYIGNGWVLTAAHVGPGNPMFPGVNGDQPFTYDGSSGRQLTTPDGTGQADLYLFHLTTTPALPNMVLGDTSGATLALNRTSVVMYGHGQSLASGLNYYDTSTNPYTVSATATSVQGYAKTSSNGAEVFRSGTNFIADSQAAVDDGYGKTDSVITYFNPLFNANAQASLGDSGGAVFGKTAGGSYELVGMMYAIGSDLNDTANQPSDDTAVYSLTSFAGDGTTTGDSITAAADISVYLSQIESITGVPEPSTRRVVVLLWVVLIESYRRRPGVRRL